MTREERFIQYTKIILAIVFIGLFIYYFKR